MYEVPSSRSKSRIRRPQEKVKGFHIIVVGPKSGVHLSGDIPLFIEKVRIPLFCVWREVLKLLPMRCFSGEGVGHTPWAMGSYAL